MLISEVAMRKLAVVVMALGVALVVVAAPPAGATKPTQTALLYGDSLVWESNQALAPAVAAKHWIADNHSFPGQAPCDWLALMADDIAQHHPATITIATAGNSFGPCMYDPSTGQAWPMGSAGYLNRYRQDLGAMFAAGLNASAKVVFVEDPPMLDPVRDAALVKVNAIAAELASEQPGVSIVTSARRQFAKRGGYTAYKPCLKTETAAMGCSGGQIAVRTVSGEPDQIGLHLCPPGLDYPNPCSVYSSGEFRFGRVLAKAMVHPPKPVRS